MRSRGLVVAIAVVLAVVAAAAVILYTNGVKQDAVSGGSLSVVIVAQQDIPANTNLNPLLDQGVFTELRVPVDAVVENAISDLSQLRGQTTTAPILMNEQIPTERLSSGEAPSGGPIGITEGHVGLTIELDGPQGGNGNIQRGDNVAVFVTFPANTPILEASLKQILAPGQFVKEIAVSQGGGITAADVQQSKVVRLDNEFTMTLVPSVRVLDIVNPSVDESGRRSGGDVTLTLDLLPPDAENVVYSNEVASVWLGLLPPENPDGYPVEATIGPQLARVIGAAK